MKNKIYLSGSCSSEQRTLMQGVANSLRNAGYCVYCPFELKIPNAWEMSQEEWAKKVFEADVEGLDDCDTFLYISPGRYSTAGSNWEQGYAYACGKKIIVVQYTNDATSLMTYSGCDVFVGCPERELSNKIAIIVEKYTCGKSNEEKPRCKTVLT